LNLEARYFSINVPAGSYVAAGTAFVQNQSSAKAVGYCFVQGDDVHDRRSAAYFLINSGQDLGGLTNVPVQASTTLLAPGQISISCLDYVGRGPAVFLGGILSVTRVGVIH